MKWNVGTKLGAGFGFVLVIFVLVGVLSYRSAQEQVREAEWVAHTHNVLTGLTVLLSHMQDAETGQRGFVITGDDTYLQPFNAGIAAAETERRRVANLVADNPRQLTRAESLAPLMADTIAEMHRLESAKSHDTADGLRVFGGVDFLRFVGGTVRIGLPRARERCFDRLAG